MLLKWQAVILNNLYETTLFDKIVIKSPAIEEIDYSVPLQIYKKINTIDELACPAPWIKVNEFVNYAHLICKSQSLEQKREKILLFDKLAAELTFTQKTEALQGKERLDKLKFNIYHVILFSSLSKCTIWPSMFKTSKTLVPALIEFYNRFFNHFTQYLDYKFDPLILSTKYSKLVKQIKEKRLAHPELFQAVETNKIEKIIEIVENGEANLINQCMKDGLYVGHVAVIHSSIDTIKALYDLKVDFELLDQQQQTALFYAVKRFDLEVIKFLVQVVKVNINHKQYQNRTPIYLAAFEGNLQIVEYLHSKGGDPEIQSKLLRTPLSKACYLGNVEVAKYLIKLGVNIQAIDHKGRTALHNAAWGRAGGRQGKRRGHIQLEDSPECVQVLVKAGHKIDFEDNDKFTPVFSAISSDAERSLRVLVNAGANLSHKTIKGQSAVFIACKYGHLRILRILIEQFNCNFLQETIQNYTPMMAALTQENKECASYLLLRFLKKNIDFVVTVKLLQCLVEFNQWRNIQHLMNWIEEKDEQISNEMKIKFLANAMESNIDGILEFTFQTKSQESINIVLEIIRQLQSSLSKDAMKRVLMSIQKFQCFNDAVITILLSEHSKGLSLPFIPLKQQITEEVLIKLLQVDSNLTQSILSVKHTLIQIVKLRLSKVLLSIMTFIDQQKELPSQNSEGIKKYSKKQIFGIIYGRTEDKINVIDYCLINGYFDMHKLLSSFYNQNYEMGEMEMRERPVIPHYRYRTIELENAKKCYLMPIQSVKQMLSYEYVCEHFLTKSELQLYFKVKKDVKSLSIDHLIVKTEESLEEMKKHIKERHLIGIDIEHYSSNNQSFICLIQIATIERVFIIDKFNRIDNKVQIFLNELFADVNKIKIFHSYDNDLKWLCEDYQIEEFQSVLDTSRIYSLMQKQKSNTPSLKWLAGEHLGLEIRKEYQRSDWRIRPLFEDMANYAATDAKVLPYLLLSMLQKFVLDSKKSHCLELIRYMQSKRMIRLSNTRRIIQIL